MQPHPKSTERVIEKNDTVILRFTGPGTHQEGEHPYRVTWEGEHPSPNSWPGCLVGKKAGDHVVLPEAEQNEVNAIILRIERP